MQYTYIFDKPYMYIMYLASSHPSPTEPFFPTSPPILCCVLLLCKCSLLLSVTKAAWAHTDEEHGQSFPGAAQVKKVALPPPAAINCQWLPGSPGELLPSPGWRVDPLDLLRILCR